MCVLKITPAFCLRLQMDYDLERSQTIFLAKNIEILPQGTEVCDCKWVDFHNVTRYSTDMIKDFKSSETALIFRGTVSRYFPFEIQPIARRKLRMLHASVSLNDLRVPPANHLEKLSGKRAGQYSIRINDQWRICFIFRDRDAYQVEIIDYHRG